MILQSRYMTSKEIKEHQFGEPEADRILNFWAREIAYQLARIYEFIAMEGKIEETHRHN